ncbi:MAG: nitroreductase family protein [Sphaerochaetaceae bacterium]|nr:nitroreductase family protein [Sphaerochaetaceae bacterium]
MKVLETIKKRRSIREFSDQIISDEDLNTILQAAMCGPSAVNSRDWQFIVVRDKDTLNKMADCNGVAAKPLRNANVGILVCADTSRSYSGAPEYYAVNCSIATQNILLQARELGIGSVWLGTWPQSQKVNNLKNLFSLPENIIPHSLIALGYPKNISELELGCRSTFDPNLIHYEKW